MSVKIRNTGNNNGIIAGRVDGSIIQATSDTAIKGGKAAAHTGIMVDSKGVHMNGSFYPIPDYVKGKGRLSQSIVNDQVTINGYRLMPDGSWQKPSFFCRLWPF